MFLGITAAPWDAQPARGGDALSARGGDALSARGLDRAAAVPAGRASSFAPSGPSLDNSGPGGPSLANSGPSLAYSGPSPADSGPSPAVSGPSRPSIVWRYPGMPPQEARAATEVVYGAPAHVLALPPCQTPVVGYIPVYHSEKLGYYVDERGGMGSMDVRVKKVRGCQGSGSRARHRFFGTYFYFNEGLFSRVVVSIFKIVY